MTRSRSTTCLVACSRETCSRACRLGVLDLVDHALRVAACTLCAEMPELIGDPHPWCPEPPELVAARRMMTQMARFARAIERYQRTREPMRAPTQLPADDDIDF